MNYDGYLLTAPNLVLYSLSTCPCGGTGRRDGFKIRFLHRSARSSRARGTISLWQFRFSLTADRLMQLVAIRHRIDMSLTYFSLPLELLRIDAAGYHAIAFSYGMSCDWPNQLFVVSIIWLTWYPNLISFKLE